MADVLFMLTVGARIKPLRSPTIDYSIGALK